MVTLYSVVKGFTDVYDAIQRNAIQSWRAVLPDAEIILFGADEPGAQEVADYYRLPILPLTYNEHGAPLIAEVIETANNLAYFDIRCLVNADIILGPSFRSAAEIVADRFAQFLLIMRRYNLKRVPPLDFDGDWHAQVCAMDSKPYTLCGSDVFCYRGDWLADMPAFGMGRTSWDNWTVETAKGKGIPIVDASEYTVAFHQHHAKNKLKVETKANQALLTKAFGKVSVGSLRAASHLLTEEGEICSV